MNIYQMYYACGKKFGFFVVRDTWGKTIAKIISIEGVEEGKGIQGRYPYFKRQKVMAEFYKADPWKIVQDIGPVINISEISCPGTYAYNLIKIEEPPTTDTIREVANYLLQENKRLRFTHVNNVEYALTVVELNTENK